MPFEGILKIVSITLYRMRSKFREIKLKTHKAAEIESQCHLHSGLICHTRHK